MSKRAMGIVRVSQRTDDTGHSPEVQARAMLKYAEDQGWQLDQHDILAENVDARDEAQARLEESSRDFDATHLIVGPDRWDDLTLDERREAVSAVIDRVTVRKGSAGAERVTIEPKALRADR
jgi:hypothetical protein